ncbi:hypothetical protein [Marinoscillum sp.]|uniref:hypothetical protein n=1 Tax=Marinoscillum sp. TaxID=2024838 RepID=UPI003BA8AB23
MRKFITPFNFIALLLFGLGVYGVMEPGTWGFGLLATFYFIPIALLIFGLDSFIRNITNRRNQYISEFIIIGVLYFSYEYSERSKTFIIPDNPTYEFVVTIYNLENQQELPTSIFTWNYEMAIPENGIILTSSSKFSDLPSTTIRTASGISLNDRNKSTELCFGRVGSGTLNCGTLKFDYAAWKIDKGGAISYSSNDIKTLERRLCQLINPD